MAGTKMTLHRYGGVEFQHWAEQEIIVDDAYLALGRGLFIKLDHKYQMGTSQLDVFYNGMHLLKGGGYEEIDSTTIRLDLGTYEGDTPLAGRPVQLSSGDEIYIRTWKAEFGQGSGNIDELRFKQLEEEVRQARKFKDEDTSYPNLDTRLDSIERRTETKTMVFVLSRVFEGVAKFVMRFPYNGDITEVYASASNAGIADTVFQIEKCSQDSYDSPSPLWENIFNDNLTIDANERSSKTSDKPHSVAITKINKDDHFRINVVGLGKGIEGVTIELVVKLR
ncbi:hypothetical protein SECTIM467_46 [Brevibacillus phage SecTim467]|uniref:Uncharacterized protein n=2 Tax=Jenstvirus jenst TaxID=1982225 RepID=A0A0K2CPK2_9CAUD|nr:hypothetical protein AVV11_gp145 [Brevibacillus phage Jenst]ALA07176.1 hypothetical protein JENST_46 [Brevibacillus phage Jenst]ALA07545.1 hypothetical protein SECTIM467_46 [Brevibacillus phage SecTim467]